MQHTERIVGALLESHPRPALDRLLAFLVRQYRADGALVCWSAAGEDAVVEMVRTMRADRLLRFNEEWRAQHGRLAAGELVVADDYVLAPLRHKQTLVGALYLDAPKRFDTDGFDYYLFVLATSLASARQDPEDGSPTPGIVVDQKAVLLLLLERHEWNISRVSRELGVTRRTVYLRMMRHNIRRRHVPKTLKPLP